MTAKRGIIVNSSSNCVLFYGYNAPTISECTRKHEPVGAKAIVNIQEKRFAKVRVQKINLW